MKPVSAVEKRISLAVLAVLAAITITIGYRQSRYDPARWTCVSPIVVAKPSAPLAPTARSGLNPMGAAEHYRPHNLSDKIDGKAELYLGAGFKGLDSQRFVLPADPELWLELLVYDMGNYPNAFAVFSAQRRDERVPLDLSADAYGSANSLFAVHGAHYLEVVAAADTPALQAAMLALAREFIAAHPLAAAKLAERDLFPEAGRQPDSTARVASKAFGFEDFDNIFTAQYRFDDAEMTLFLSRRESTPEAARLAHSYRDFLARYGGIVLDPPADPTGVYLIDIMDTVELVGTRGVWLLGVHEAPSAARARELAARLIANIEASGHEP